MIKGSKLREQIASFDFEAAFLDRNWNHPQRSEFIKTIRERTLRFRPIAEVSGIVALEVTETTATMPAVTSPQAHDLRRMVDAEIAKEMAQHILIFVDSMRTDAVWHFAKTVKGKRIHRELRANRTFPVEPLVKRLRGMEVPLDLLDEDGEFPHAQALDMMDQAGLYAEKVSKKFWDLLAKQRDTFEPFLSWIEDEEKRSWYVTALLNRLMFIYFIQHKGLMNGDTSYLSKKLEETRKAGADRFYREFFLPLCFFALGKPDAERGPHRESFKGLPYLNGGIFLPHPVETELGITPDAIAKGELPDTAIVPDSEFERWFGFFDSWRWTLEEKRIEYEREINPDILGYIFEKYINQKQMGAYYTKEDITGYICRNTIVPRLFDMLAETGAKGKQAVEPLPIGPHPNLLNAGRGMSQGEGIDRYIYDAVKKTDYLPTETEREFDAREKRYQSILQDFDDGKIATVNDFITYNLDMEIMAADFIGAIQDAEVLRDFYFKCIKKITVLDPTCGSGAFLFAAARILYPLYTACLRKMREMCERQTPGQSVVGTWKGEFAFANEVDEQLAFLDTRPAERNRILSEFRAELAGIAEHPNPEYFVYKTIIVNNLFGVDIMDEAVEICKLRLFLKLIAHAEPDEAHENRGIEPLPDIDFNILAGNTLVGYTSFADIDRMWDTSGHLPFEKNLTRLHVWVGEYKDELRIFRECQLGMRASSGVTKDSLARTHCRAKAELDEDLWHLYRTTHNIKNKTPQKEFVKSHQPFHWFLDFPDLLLTDKRPRGLDAIVGNPPYAELKEVKQYGLISYRCAEAGNLYALVIERCLQFAHERGRLGFIVPVSSVSADRYATLQKLLGTRHLHYSSFDDRPSRLFNGLEHIRLTILLMGTPSAGPEFYSTRYNKWTTEERSHLFHSLRYARSDTALIANTFPKLSSPVERGIIEKLSAQRNRLSRYYANREGYGVLYSRKVGYFLQVLDFAPSVLDGNGRLRSPSEFKRLNFDSEPQARLALCVLNSNLFYWFITAFSDCRHVNKREVDAFPIDMDALAASAHRARLMELAFALMGDLAQHAEHRKMKSGHEVLTVQCIIPKHSKPIIDEIDRVLAKHYGFTEEELDFIINYDIKYRMGRDTQDDEDSR